MISIRARAIVALIAPVIAVGLAVSPTASAKDDFGAALDACQLAGGGLAFCCENLGGTFTGKPPYDPQTYGICVYPSTMDVSQETGTPPKPTKPGVPPVVTSPASERGLGR